MFRWIFRGVFLVTGVSIGYKLGETLGNPLWGIILGIVSSLAIIAFEWFMGGRPIAIISSLLFGVILGLIFMVMAEQMLILVTGPAEQWFAEPERGLQVLQNIRVAMLIAFIYLGASILYQTRDRFSMIIPYIEFRREEKGVKPIILDTSVLVDGRVGDVLKTGIIDDPIIVPEMVLEELHNIADSDDKTRRERGRLGMKVLDLLRESPKVDFSIQQLDSDTKKPVDQRLVDVAKQLGARIMTNDYNLNRVASIGGIDVVNLNELANALKPTALPEEEITIKLVRSGEQRGQAVGFLEDGTMVVVEDGVKMLGKEVPVKVTNTITRDSGRIVFAELAAPASRRNYSRG